MNGLFSMLGKIMRNRIVLLSEFVKLCLAFPYSYHFCFHFLLSSGEKMMMTKFKIERSKNSLLV